MGPISSSVVALQTDLARPCPAKLCFAASKRSLIVCPAIDILNRFFMNSLTRVNRNGRRRFNVSLAHTRVIQTTTSLKNSNESSRENKFFLQYFFFLSRHFFQLLYLPRLSLAHWLICTISIRCGLMLKAQSMKMDFNTRMYA